MKLKQKSEMERGERARPLPTTFLKGPKLGSLGVFVFGIPGFSQARSGGAPGLPVLPGFRLCVA